MDTKFYIYIVSFNIDVCWSREKRMVDGAITAFRKSIAADNLLRMDQKFPDLGPWLDEDNNGVQVALRIITASKCVGSYHKLNQQFTTIYELKTLFSKSYKISRGAGEQSIT